MKSPVGVWGSSLLIMAATSCGLAASEATLAKGAWGGDTAILEVVEGGANLEFECAQGRIEGPIRIDSQGDFDLPGTMTSQGPGPSRDDGTSAAAVRYQGHVKGDAMTLVVRNASAQIGSHTLTRGRQPILRACR